MDELAVVVIGRNEQQALQGCFDSIRGVTQHVVYADSASDDDSAGVARRAGVACVVLDRTQPLSAARGRNAGWEYLKEHAPQVKWIQFADGDTTLAPGWLQLATDYLKEHDDVGVVAGRLRERFADRNVYHRLADMEFDTPTGSVDAVGGIALYRAEAFERVGGFDPKVVSGEEWEVCSRIRGLGLKAVRLPDPMAQHDIDMSEFRVWWKRVRRSGQTYAEHWLDRGVMSRRVLSILFWGGVFPSAAIGMALPTLGLSSALLLAYPIQWHRIRRYRIMQGDSASNASLYAAATLVGKLAECEGVLRTGLRRVLRAR